MVSLFDFSSGGSGSSRRRGFCVVLLDRAFTLTVPLFTQVYKWVPANCWGNLTERW